MRNILTALPYFLLDNPETGVHDGFFAKLTAAARIFGPACWIPAMMRPGMAPT